MLLSQYGHYKSILFQNRDQEILNKLYIVFIIKSDI
jgi:hypothetical protein